MLLLDILFDLGGNSKTLGDIDVLLVVIYGFYSFYLFASFEKTEVISAKEEEVTADAPQGTAQLEEK